MDEYKASNTLFGKVKKDVALSKAVSIMNRSQRSKGQSSSSSKEEGHNFSRGPPAMYGGAGRARIHTCTHPKASNGGNITGEGLSAIQSPPGSDVPQLKLPQGDPNQQVQKF